MVGFAREGALDGNGVTGFAQTAGFLCRWVLFLLVGLLLLDAYEEGSRCLRLEYV